MLRSGIYATCSPPRRMDCQGPRATSVHDTQQQAINVAREIVLIQQSELVIHRRDGRIRDKDSHGNNPFRSKG